MANEKKREVAIRSSAAEYLTFVASTGESDVSFEMRYEDENIWLTQKMMAVLYDVSLPTINEHIKKIYADGELTEEATIRKFRIVQEEGTRKVNRELTHYNLQMIIAVGFKVNNQRAVQFRKWAGQIVKDYTIQGWTMDAERLKKVICSQMNTLIGSCSRLGRFDCRSASSIRRSRICMRPHLIMIKMQKQRGCSLKPYKIKCILQFIVIRQQN